MNKALEWAIIVVLAVSLFYFLLPFAPHESSVLGETVKEPGAPNERAIPFIAVGDYSFPLSALIGSLLVFLLVVALLWPVIERK